MKHSHNHLLPVLFVFALMCSGCSKRDSTADLIIQNAKIITVDAVFSIAEAAAIKDGKFLQVGTEERCP